MTIVAQVWECYKLLIASVVETACKRGYKSSLLKSANQSLQSDVSCMVPPAGWGRTAAVFWPSHLPQLLQLAACLSLSVVNYVTPRHGTMGCRENTFNFCTVGLYEQEIVRHQRLGLGSYPAAGQGFAPLVWDPAAMRLPDNYHSRPKPRKACDPCLTFHENTSLNTASAALRCHLFPWQWLSTAVYRQLAYSGMMREKKWFLIIERF